MCVSTATSGTGGAKNWCPTDLRSSTLSSQRKLEPSDASTSGRGQIRGELPIVCRRKRNDCQIDNRGEMTGPRPPRGVGRPSTTPRYRPRSRFQRIRGCRKPAQERIVFIPPAASILQRELLTQFSCNPVGELLRVSVVLWRSDNRRTPTEDGIFAIRRHRRSPDAEGSSLQVPRRSSLPCPFVTLRRNSSYDSQIVPRFETNITKTRT
jgi:hypothetical protein